MRENSERLRDVLAAYGADPARWPARDREHLTHRIDGPDAPYEDALAVDRLLRLASPPHLRLDAADRVIRQASAFRPAVHRPILRWAAAVPLAASLLLGLYLGEQADVTGWLPGFEQASVEDSDDDLSGVGEAETYAEENLT